MPWDQRLSLATGQVNCTPGEVSCIDGACVGTIHLCDGIWDCPDGANEGPGHCPLPSLPTPPAGTLPGPSAVSRETAPTPQFSVSPGESPGGKGVRKWGLEAWKGGDSTSEGGLGADAGGGKEQGPDSASWRHWNEGSEERLQGTERVQTLFPEVQGPPLNRLASNGNSWMRRESFWKTRRAAKSGSGWTWGGPGAGRGPEGPGGGAEPEAVEGPGGLQASPGAPPGWSAEAPAAPPCGLFASGGGSGECAPRGRRCDGEDGEDGRHRPCAPHLPPCARGPLCVAPAQLCDGAAHCPHGSDGDPGACGSGWRSLESDSGLGAAESERVLSSLNLFPETLFEHSCLPAQPRGREERAFVFAHIWAGCIRGWAVSVSAAGGGGQFGGAPPSFSLPGLGVPSVSPQVRPSRPGHLVAAGRCPQAPSPPLWPAPTGPLTKVSEPGCVP